MLKDDTDRTGDFKRLDKIFLFLFRKQISTEQINHASGLHAYVG